MPFVVILEDLPAFGFKWKVLKDNIVDISKVLYVVEI